MSQNKTCSILMAGVAGIVLLPAGVVTQAQTEDGSVATQNSSRPVLEEIMVTARRQNERLSDVPISIHMETGESLAASGVTSLKELTQVAPGVNFTFIGGSALPTMRGVSSQSTAAGAENNVAIYVDGVYQSNIYGNSFELPDVDRVEMLKGPQGTLYGRNATGGAMLIYTRNPSFENTGSFELSTGVYDGGANLMSGKGFIAGALSETMAGSLSVMYTDNEGYFDDELRGGTVGDIESSMLRAKLLYEPSGSASFLLSAYYGDRKDETVFAGQNINSPFATTLGATVHEEYKVMNDVVGFTDVKSYGGSLRADIELDSGSITSITGYGRVKPYVLADADGTAIPAMVYELNQPGETISQDVSFASNQFGIFNYIVGGMAYRGVEEFLPLAVKSTADGPPLYAVYSRSIAEAYAVYGELTADISPEWSVTGGVRYSHETREIKGALFARPDSLPHVAEESFDDWTPRISVNYIPSDRYNVYFTYAEGFKSGMYDTSALPTVPVQPERLKSYEVGVKYDASGSVQVNAAIFHYDVTDLQTSTNDEQGLAILANAGKAKIQGGELEVNWQLTREFRLNASASYIPTADYKQFPEAAFIAPVPGGGGMNAVRDMSGERIARTPEWQASVLASYETVVANGRVGGSMNVAYSSDFAYELSRTVVQDDNTLVNAQLYWSSDASGLTATLWGKNLTNEATINNYLVNETGFNVVYQAPRALGISLGYDF